MSEHSSARRRPRVPRGRHAAGPSAAASGAHDDEAARAARARAFGDGASSAEPVTPGAPASGTASGADRSSTGRHRGEPRRSAGPAGAARERGRRSAAAAAPASGSLGRSAGWTVLTTIIPGAGLLTTRLRWLGILLIAALVILVGGGIAWYLLADPLPFLLGVASNRTYLIGALVLAILAGLVWVGQILLANLSHNTRERLHGGRRAVSVLLAVVLMGAAAAPFALGANGLYSAQGLLGNRSVFGGTDDGTIATGADPWANTKRLNVMLLGQDAGADRTGTRPDTIMVASIDTKTGRTALFSLPRNLQYVRFPAGTVEAKQFPEGFDAFGKDENLLNAVWSWADDNKDLFPGDPEPGLTATRHAVEQTLGLTIDYYGMVDLAGFQGLVDAIGGVDIDVERRIPIGGGTNQATGGKYPITGWIEPGEQHLDGYHALWYARSREGSDDFNRMCRQQRMIRVVSEEADPMTLALAFPQLVSTTEKNIVTDIPANRLDAFVTLAQRVQKAGFASYPVTHDTDAPGADSWRTGGHPDWDYLHQWVQTSIEESMSQAKPESATGAAPAASTPAPAASSSPADQESPSDKSASPTTAPETTAPESDDDADATTAAAPASPAPTTAPVDPLTSCMPAGEQG